MLLISAFAELKMFAARNALPILEPVREPDDRSQSGSIAIVFALSLTAFFALLALAIDAGNAARQRDQLQGSLDAAALAGARAALSGNDARTAIEEYVAANWALQNPGTPAALNRVSINEGAIELTARAKAPSYFGRVIGSTGIDIEVASHVKFGLGDVEIALVMDNTASMDGAKLAALKDAAHALVDEVTAAPDADQKLRIGLVPFGRYVNVGLGYRNESWLDVEDDSSTTSHQCWNTYPNAVSSNCRMEIVNYDNDGTPASYDTEVCDWDYGDPVEVCGDQTVNRTWHGCVGSRNAALDLDAEVTPGNPVPGIMDVACGSALARLDNNWAAIRGGIDAMWAADSTYIPSGLLWGWRLLTHKAPFSDGDNPSVNTEVRKVLVLMTDGENTLSPTAPTHDGGDKAQANAITADLCMRIKADGITIFTVSFQVVDPVTVGLLQSCASSADQSYAAESAMELERAFAEIGGTILAMRLTR